MNRYLIINDETIAILADASAPLLDAIRELLEGKGIMEIAHDALNRDDRRNLLICRDHLIAL